MTKREELIKELENKTYSFGSYEAMQHDEDLHYALTQGAEENLWQELLCHCPQNYKCLEGTDEMCGIWYDDEMRNNVDKCVICWKKALGE